MTPVTTKPVPVPTGTTTIQLVLPPQPRLSGVENPAIVVPIVTLVGVVLTIVFGWRKMREELTASATQANIDREEARKRAEVDQTHAADQARKDRLTKARREVYLDLIKEMTSSSMALSALPSGEGATVDMEGGFKGMLSAVNQVAVLGEMDTLVKSRELVGLLQQVLFKMMPAIVEMRVIKMEAQSYRQKFEQQSAIMEQMNTILRNNVLNGGNVPMGQAKELHDFAHTSAKGLLDSAFKQEEQHMKKLRKYQKDVMDETGVLVFKTNELITCMRKELELETDPVLLAQSAQEMRDSAVKSIDDMLAQFPEK